MLNQKIFYYVHIRSINLKYKNMLIVEIVQRIIRQIGPAYGAAQQFFALHTMKLLIATVLSYYCYSREGGFRALLSDDSRLSKSARFSSTVFDLVKAHTKQLRALNLLLCNLVAFPD